MEAMGDRVDKEDPEITAKMDVMSEDLIEDRENGLFEGWAMAADITDRDYSTKMHFNLVSISPIEFELKGNHSLEPYLRYKTAQLNYVCQ